MRNIFFAIGFLFFLNNAGAHTPQVSTISFIQNENKSWSVFITAPLYTFQLAIHEMDPRINIDSIDLASTQQLVVTLIKNNLKINDDESIKLVNSKIQLAHETIIYFEIEDLLIINEVDFKAFNKLRDHFTLLKLVPQNKVEYNYVLNSDNKYVYKVEDVLMLGGFFNLNKYLDIVYRIGSRYILIAGIAFLIFYILFKRKILYKKIQSVLPKNSDYLREFSFSIMTVFIFGLVIITVMGNPNIRPYTKIYDDIHEKGWLYYFAAFIPMIVIHDTYFYWTHRLMHHKRLFKVFHLVHHKSTNPSPWAAYAFHPLEAVVENGIFLVFAFSFPLHESHTPIFFLFSVIYNIYGHLGWELFPRNFHKTVIGKWINTSVCHNQHHKYFKGNYGLYFLFWDRWMGTLRDDYNISFEEVKNRENSIHRRISN